jgi:hypothetical protein
MDANEKEIDLAQRILMLFWRMNDLIWNRFALSFAQSN